MALTVGEEVQTPDGSVGRLIKPTTGSGWPYYFDLEAQADVAAYPVLMDQGEVRFFTPDALTMPVRRSGTLK